MHFVGAVYLLSFCFDNVTSHTRLNHAKLYVKSIHVIKTCFHCALVPKKKESRERKCLIILLTSSCFSSCLSNVQTDLHHMLLILTNPIRCMINIKACYLFDILCIKKQVGIRGFLQYFILFFSSF